MNPYDEDEDDGETIVDMNVEGMPWYDRRRSLTNLGNNLTGGRKRGKGEFTKEETRAYTFAALKASLIVVAIFAVVFGAFIAFCDFVLFR